MLVAERRSDPTPYSFVRTFLHDNYQLCGRTHIIHDVVLLCGGVVVQKLSSKKKKKSRK